MDHNDEEMNGILHQEGRDKEEAIMEDLNSSVGEESTNKVANPFELGRRNERGKTLIDF